MHLSRLRLHVRCPRLALRLSLLLLVGLSACGPAPSDHAPRAEPRAGLGGPSQAQPASQNRPSSHNDPFTPAAGPVPVASPRASNPAPVPDQKESPVPRPDRLVLPDRLAQALPSSEAPVFLRALDMWAQQGAQALVVRLDDEDDDVSTQAMSIIERHNWEAAQEAESPGEEKEQKEIRGEQEGR